MEATTTATVATVAICWDHCLVEITEIMETMATATHKDVSLKSLKLSMVAHTIMVMLRTTHMLPTIRIPMANTKSSKSFA